LLMAVNKYYLLNVGQLTGARLTNENWTGTKVNRDRPEAIHTWTSWSPAR